MTDLEATVEGFPASAFDLVVRRSLLGGEFSFLAVKLGVGSVCEAEIVVVESGRGVGRLLEGGEGQSHLFRGKIAAMKAVAS